MTVDHRADIRAPAIEFGVNVNLHGRSVSARARPAITIDNDEIGLRQAASHRAAAVDQKAGFLAEADMPIEIDDAVRLENAQGRQQLSGHGDDRYGDGRDRRGDVSADAISVGAGPR